jgi:hypothetical protein
MSTKFTAQIFRWLAQVNSDRELLPSCAKIALALAPHFNEKRDGMTWPGFQTIADAAALSKSVVVAGLRKMEARGHVKTEPGKAGRGHSTRYWLVEKGRDADLFAAEKRPENAPEKRSVQRAKRSAGRPDSSKNHPPEEVPTEPPPPEREIEVAGATSHAPAAARGLGAATAKGDSDIAPPEPLENPQEGEAEARASFDRLRSFWRRGHLSDDSPKAVAAQLRAYRAAREGGADADAIEAGAIAWIAAADAPRFLPPLATFLTTEGWTKAPPSPKRRCVSRPRGNGWRGRKPDLFAIGMEQCQDDEAPEGGSLVYGCLQ